MSIQYSIRSAKKLTRCLSDVYIHKIYLTFIIQSDLRITIMIPSHSGLFRPFNATFLVLFIVYVFKLCFISLNTHVIKVFRFNFSIRRHNQAPKCKFQYSVLLQAERAVKSYELFYNPLGTVTITLIIPNE